MIAFLSACVLLLCLAAATHATQDPDALAPYLCFKRNSNVTTHTFQFAILQKQTPVDTCSEKCSAYSSAFVPCEFPSNNLEPSGYFQGKTDQLEIIGGYAILSESDHFCFCQPPDAKLAYRNATHELLHHVELLVADYPRLHAPLAPAAAALDALASTGVDPASLARMKTALQAYEHELHHAQELWKEARTTRRLLDPVFATRIELQNTMLVRAHLKVLDVSGDFFATNTMRATVNAFYDAQIKVGSMVAGLPAFQDQKGLYDSANALYPAYLLKRRSNKLTHACSALGDIQSRT